MQKTKIDVLLPDSSSYNVLHHFCQKIFEALQRAKYDCRLLEGNERYTLSLTSPPDFTLGFNGALKIDDGKLFCDYTNIPHISCLVDPPYRFMELANSQNVLVTCDDEFCSNHFKYLFKDTCFMPQAVERELALEDEVEKIYDVVMLATYIDCEKRRADWKQKYPKNIYQGMQEAVELTLSDQTTSFIFALEQTLGMHFKENIEVALMQNIFSEVELYLKGRDKLDLLHSITDTEVHVFGNSIDHQGWKETCINHPNVVIHPAVSFLEALQIMKQTKILLNSNIKNKHGPHERIFSGAAAGAIIMTDDNAYIRKHFTDDKDILLYDRTDFENLNMRLHDLLNNDPRRKEMSKQARAKILANHTWDHRVAELVALKIIID